MACGLTPTCEDLASVWFDFCPTPLGAAVIDGACTLVSGCDSGDYTLFVDVAECEAAGGEAGESAGSDSPGCSLKL